MEKAVLARLPPFLFAINSNQSDAYQLDDGYHFPQVELMFVAAE